MGLNGGVCNTALCQHPECWKASVQKVKEAVRLRNGIKFETTATNAGTDEIFSVKKEVDEFSDGSLPTLKVIDVFNDVELGTKSLCKPQARFHKQSPSVPSATPRMRKYFTPSHKRTKSAGFHPPRPSPTSPTLTDYQKRMLWKKRFASTPDIRDQNATKQVSAVGVHELYDADELQQDWPDVYITSAYLVWCPSTKKKKRRKRVSSSKSDSIVGQMKKVLPKDLTEAMVPSTMELHRPKKAKSSKTPTGGQPYSPSRTHQKNYVHIEHLDLAKYGLEEFADLPRPVLAGILQQLQPRESIVEHRTADRPQQTKSKDKKKQADVLSSSEETALKSLEESAKEEGSRRLLDVDIKSRFTTPEEDEMDLDSEAEKPEKSNVKNINNTKTEDDVANLLKEADDKLAVRQGRSLLPVSAVGIPTEDLPKVKDHHCVRSIPNYHLNASMEPVNLVPATPSPVATPPSVAETAGQGQSHRTTRSHSSMYVNVHSGRDSLFEEEYMYEPPYGYHLTSALRFSPLPLRVPAPTPSSPDKAHEYYSRMSQTGTSGHRYSHREGNDELSLTRRRHTTLSSLSDVEQGGTNYGRGSPVGREDGADKQPIRVPTGQVGEMHDKAPERQNNVTYKETQDFGYRVFLTEEGAPGGEPAVSPLYSRFDLEEWPRDGVVMNFIEPSSEAPNVWSQRSPSPGSKTYIPQDILAEFHGDPYGQWHPKQPHRMSKPFNSLPESMTTEEHANYMVITKGGMSAPSWRPPRSRTPIQFSATASRSAPRPLKQPSADCVPRSLSVQRIAPPLRQRPSSTPSRVISPKEPPIQPVLSGSSLHAAFALEGTAEGSIGGPSGGSSDTGGSVPPPPSPELPLQQSVTAAQLEPLREEDERSSVCASLTGEALHLTCVDRPSPLGEEKETSSSRNAMGEETESSSSKNAKREEDESSSSKNTVVEGTECSSSKNARCEETESSSSKNAKREEDESSSSKNTVVEGTECSSSKSAMREENESSSSKNAVVEDNKASSSKTAEKPLSPQAVAGREGKETLENATAAEVESSAVNKIEEPGVGTTNTEKDSSPDNGRADGGKGVNEEPPSLSSVARSSLQEEADKPEDNQDTSQSDELELTAGGLQEVRNKLNSMNLDSQDHCEIKPESNKSQEETQFPTSPGIGEDFGREEILSPVAPQPPGSPELNETPDFTSGLDLSMDLEAELQMAMSGLDDLENEDEDADEWGLEEEAEAVARAHAPDLQPWD